VKREIDRNELAEIVGEVALSAEREHELLSVEEAQQVLQELDLPADRLEQARAVIASRRQELAARRKRRLLTGLAVGTVVLAAALLGYRAHSQQQALAQIGVADADLELAPGQPATTFSRSTLPQVTLRAALNRAPRGENVELGCRWNAPGGAVRYENRWDTKAIDRDLWPTHCRQRFTASDPPGAWSVTLTQGERPLTTLQFVLQ
jgi:hypothetical protein